VIQEQVQSNKDFDVPTQRENLSQFRCDEIAKAALDVFNEQIRSVRRPIEAGNGRNYGWVERHRIRFVLFLFFT